MRKGRFFAACLSAVVLSAGFAACGSDDEPVPVPVIDPVELKDAYAYDGAATAVGSVVWSGQADAVTFYFTPRTGVTDAAQLEADAEYVMVCADRSLLAKADGKPVDLTRIEAGRFKVCYKTKEGTVLDASDPASLLSGRCTVAIEPLADGGSKVAADLAIETRTRHTLAMNVAFTYREEPEELKEGLWLGGSEVEVNSAFLYDYYISGVRHSVVALSSEAGAPSGDYLYTHRSPGLYMVLRYDLEKPFDLMSVGEGYSLWTTFPETVMPLLNVDPTDCSAITSGTCQLIVDEEGMGHFSLQTRLKDGRLLSVLFDIPYKQLDASNTLTIGDLTRPIQTAFYERTDEDRYAFYFTPSLIDPNPAKIEDCFQSAVLIVPGEVLDGRTVDLAAADAAYESFQAAKLIDFDAIKFYTVEARPGGSCVGEFSLLRREDGTFFLNITCLDAANETVQVIYDGTIEEYVKPVLPNEYSLDGTSTPIRSVVVEMRDNLCSIYLAAAEGLTTVEQMLAEKARVDLTLPADWLDGRPSGFSLDDRVGITFDGQTYNYQSGAMGRITATLKEDKLEVDFFIFGTPNLTGHYTGTVSLIR